MTVHEFNALHTVCDLGRNQLMRRFSMSVQKPQLAGILLTGYRSNFFYVESCTAWRYDCPNLLSPLYKEDRCFDRIPLPGNETLRSVESISRQPLHIMLHLDHVTMLFKTS